jgi:hypothetical protein
MVGIVLLVLVVFAFLAVKFMKIKAASDSSNGLRTQELASREPRDASLDRIPSPSIQGTSMDNGLKTQVLAPREIRGTSLDSIPSTPIRGTSIGRLDNEVV